MTLYRLIDSKDANFLSLLPFGIEIFFLLSAIVLFFCIQDRTSAQIIFAMIIALVFFLFPFACSKYKYYRSSATLEGGVLTIYSPKGKRIRSYRLDEMNKAYVVADHEYRGGLYHKCLLLCKKGLVLEGDYQNFDGELLPEVKLYQYSGTDRKKMVTVENKALEEKILAYYAEQLIEGQE